MYMTSKGAAQMTGLVLFPSTDEARGHPDVPLLSLNGIGGAKGTRPTSARPVSASLPTDRLRPQTARAQVGFQCHSDFLSFATL